MPRRCILTADEKAVFETPPLFSAAERKRFFSTPTQVEAILNTLRTPTNRACFLLMLGYFKSGNRFYRNQFHDGDVSFVGRRFGYFPELLDPGSLDEATYRRYRSAILEYLGFTPFDNSVNRDLLHHLQPMVRSQARAKFMLKRALDFLERRKTAVPTLRTLTEIVLNAVQRHREKLNQLVEASLPASTRQLLDDLLTKPEADGPNSQRLQRYRLTLLKRVSQSMRVKKIRATVADLQTLRSLFAVIQPMVQSLDLTDDGIRFYAQSVAKSRIFQVARREDEDRYLHLVCFIAHQYLRLQDTLVDVFLLSVRKHPRSLWGGAPPSTW